MPLSIISIDIDPVLVQLGPISIHWYGLMYVIGIGVALYASLPFAQKLGINRDQAYEIFWPVLIACLIGGRLYYVVQANFGWYLRHPQNILATWEGGMAFYGAVFLGVPTAYVVCRLRHVSFARVLDAGALFIPLAQSFGRVGNVINGDVLGYQSNLPWALKYTNPHNSFVPSHVVAYQPAAAYELLFSLGLFILVWLLRFRFRTPATLFAIWLVTYSIGQFFLFFTRANAVVLLGLKQAQLTAIIVVALAVPLYLLWRNFYLSRGDREMEEPEPVQAEESVGEQAQEA